MRKPIWAAAICLLIGSFTSSATTLITGTPNNSDNSTDTPTGLSPTFGTLINFDNLTPNSLVSSNAYASSGVSYIANTNGTTALSALPYSSQSYPNYLGPADFSSLYTEITLTNDTGEVGIGLLAGSSDSFTLTALGNSNNVLGSYTVSDPTTGVNAYNGYFAISDISSDIKSLLVVSSGGGIDDLQFLPASTAATPEPANVALLGLGLSLMSGVSLYRRKKS